MVMSCTLRAPCMKCRHEAEREAALAQQSCHIRLPFVLHSRQAVILPSCTMLASMCSSLPRPQPCSGSSTPSGPACLHDAIPQLLCAVCWLAYRSHQGRKLLLGPPQNDITCSE